MASRFANQNARALEGTQGKLSSGKRITKASDDAARLAISTNMNARSRGQSQALRNTNDAISIVQMAEGGLQEVNSLISRVKELALQSATASVTSSERFMISNEAMEALKQAKSVSGINVLFGHELLSGQTNSLDLQIDAGSGSSSRIKMNLSELDMRPETLGLTASDINLETAYGAQQSLEKLTSALDRVGSVSSKLGSYQQRFLSTTEQLSNSILNKETTQSRMMDADYAQESANLVMQNLRQNANTSVASQLHFDLKQAVRLIE
jgi:flagellin